MGWACIVMNMRFRLFYSVLALLLFFVLSPANAVEVETPQFVVEIPGEDWRHLPLEQGATPWRYARSLSETHSLFTAITWIPLDGEDGPAPDKADVVERIVTEARRQAEMPGRRMLDWARGEDSGVAEGQGCWHYGAAFQVAVAEDEWIDYRSRGFICHVPGSEGLAWLRYDELKDLEESWKSGYEEAAIEMRRSLQPAQ